MSGSIYLIQGDDELVEMNEEPYDSEDLLQELLAKYPNLLAGDQMDDAAPAIHSNGAETADHTASPMPFSASHPALLCSTISSSPWRSVPSLRRGSVDTLIGN